MSDIFTLQIACDFITLFRTQNGLPVLRVAHATDGKGSERELMMPRWRMAYEAVWSLLPCTREHITESRASITPDIILKHAVSGACDVRAGAVAQWREHESGSGLYSKWELFDLVFHDELIHRGELILITDDCFPIGEREPFFGKGESLREFLAEAPFVFDGDAVFIWPAARHISVFHHEGYYAHIDCRRSQV